MIKAIYDTNSYTVLFQASGDDFHEVIRLFKSNKLQYTPTKRVWETNALNALDVITEAEELCIPVTIDDYDLSKIKENKYIFGKKETKFKRRKLDKSLLKVPPWKGKSPYENYQEDVIKRGISQNRLGIYLGIRTGKTYVVTSIVNHLFKWNDVDRLLIVCPPEGVVNWKRELLRFSTFIVNEEDILISSANHNRDFIELGQDKKVIICTYRHFMTVSNDYYKKKTGKKGKKYRIPVIPFDTWGNNRVIIRDESHNAKSYNAKTTRVLDIHKNYFEYRYDLTGTPNPNDFTELYTQVRFLEPSVLPHNYYDWLRSVANLGNRFSDYAINFLYDTKVDEWEKVFQPYVVRIKTEDVLDLSELYIKPIYVEMTDLQKSIYQQLVNHEITVLKEQEGRIIPRQLINRFPYISQALDNPKLLVGKVDKVKSSQLYKDVEKFNFEKDHEKVEVLKSLIDKHISNGEKMVIYDYHPKTLDMLGKIFSKYNPIVVHGEGLHGLQNQDIHEIKNTAVKRDYAIEEFKQRDDCKLLIASSKVMTTSINLQAASAAVYFARDYSYLNWYQSYGRLIGGGKMTTIYPMIFEDSLDIALQKSLDNKEDLDKSVFSRTVKNKESLNLDEWKEFFRGKK